MLIQFKNVTVEKDGQIILHDLSCELSERRVGILGANGSGKSTWLRLFNGLQRPDQGQVLLDGLDVSVHLTEIRRRVGFIFQNPDNQLVLPIVGEDIDLGLKRRFAERAVRVQHVRAALEQVAGEHLIDRVVHTLSGGEKQLVALAAVLATSPEILVFDEPTTQLDLKHARRFVRLLAALTQPCIVVSHDLSLLKEMDRVLVIDQGRIVHDADASAAIAWYETECDR